MSTQYVCTGGCGGAVSEEEFSGGKTACGTEGCANHAQPFEKRIVCDACGGQSAEGEAHSCGM
ncbi:MAG: hypothetical protein AAB579_02790 [Patescibacteria group bacterium]